MLITQRVQLRQDDIPLGEQTVAQVSSSALFCDSCEEIQSEL